MFLMACALPACLVHKRRDTCPKCKQDRLHIDNTARKKQVTVLLLDKIQDGVLVSHQEPESARHACSMQWLLPMHLHDMCMCATQGRCQNSHSRRQNVRCHQTAGRPSELLYAEGVSVQQGA